MPKKKIQEERPPMPMPGDPDYRAIRVAVYTGHCSFRSPLEKEKADPYLIVSYNGVSYEAKQLTRTTHPKWNEVWEFPLAKHELESLGELSIEMWDRNDKKKKKGQIFLGEIKLPMCEISDVNYEYCEARRYPLQKRGKEETKKDRVKGDLLIKVGMVLPARPKQHNINTGGSNETQKIINQSEDVVDESLASAQRSLKMALNTRDTGTETLEKLNAQGDQLKRVQGYVDDIDEMQEKGERHMRGISSITGAISNQFTPSVQKPKDRSKKADKLSSKTRKKKQKEMEEEQEKVQKIESKAERNRRHKREVRRRGHDGNGSDDHHFEESGYKPDLTMLSDTSQQKVKQTDDILDQIGNIMDDLKIQALEMGDELDDHNARLTVLKEGVHETQTKMKYMNRKIDHRLGN